MNTATALAPTARMKSTQKELILSHLHSIDLDNGKRRGITHYEALGLYRINRLAARIHELRASGWSIVSHRKTDNTGKRYERYYLESRQRK